MSHWIYLLLVLILFSCGRLLTSTNEPDTALKEIYLEELGEFHFSLDRFATSIEEGEELMTAFGDVRIAFKRIEFLMEYTDREVHQLFNGPPVLAETYGSTGFQVTFPQGLQVIDEMLCREPLPVAQLKDLTRELQYQADLYSRSIRTLNLDTDHYLRAMLLHLIRIETLSLAGFDHHCVDQRTDELVRSIEAIEGYLALIVNDSNNESLHRAALLKEMFSRKGGLAQIDLAHVIREYIEPFRNSLIKLCLSDPADVPQAINLYTVSLYDANFINSTFYSTYGIKKVESTPKIDLGRKLFQDPALSTTGTISCATCHMPYKFFADGQSVSMSADPEETQLRNTPTLIHSAYQNKYMYDGRAVSLEDQMLHVFRNRKEFQSHITEVIDRLARDELYAAAFASLYPEMSGQPVNLHSVTDAIATYIRSLTGHNSPFDQYMRGELTELPEGSLEGFNLFMKKGECGTCHFPPTFSGLRPPFYLESEFENLGVPGLDENGEWAIDEDPGRWHFYNHPAFRHFFKTPTLRNSDMTAPYMHNGIFSDLDAVMDFYDHGGGAGAGLDYPNQSLPSDTLHLTDSEKQQIGKFLESLTDPAYLYYK